jgi:tetratricopeptide (TPR) repeat protein
MLLTPVMGHAQAERTDLSAGARASVAQALYAASATTVAAERAADARIAEQRKQIAGLQNQLQTQLKASAGRDAVQQARVAQLQTQLTQAQERFVAQLSERDRAYAREIAVFRGAVQDIASTPEGEAALRQYNAGDETGALLVLDRLVDAREQARKERANIETAAERRRVAALALDARNKGKVNTLAVIARYNEVTRLDPGLHRDWMELARLYQDAGNLPQARQATERAAQTANDDRDRPVALDEIGAILVAQNDLPSARARFQESYDIAKRLAAADPSSASLRRDVVVSLWKLAGLENTSAAWEQVVSTLEDMQRRGVLRPADARLIDEARAKARSNSVK